MAEKQWVVGLFEEENKFSVIPSNWIVQLGNTTFCQWPKKRITDTMIINYENPTKDWQPFPVKIIEQYSTYEQASKREKEIFLQSSESDQSVGRGKRKRKMKFKRNDAHSDDSDTDSSAALTPIKVMKDLNQTTITENKLDTLFKTPLNLDAEPFVASTSSTNNIVSAAMQILYNESSNDNIFNINTFESGDNHSNIIIDNLHDQPTDDTSNLSINYRDNIVNDNNMISKILENVVAIHAYVKRHDARLDKIEKFLQENSYSSYKCEKNKVFDDDFIVLFPMKDIEAITSINDKIKTDPTFESQMRAFIKTIGGTDTKNFTKRVLHRLFTNELSSKCSWTGFKSNFRLENLMLIEIMKEISRINFKGTDILFENHVKDWFRHGAQRVLRDKLKTSIID
ncbi:uncharacterized protein LOC132941229 isoform X1 [Metopolophium dirhodum]|uniref:uncharacterized protein LOC132941229 isoform X1 n=1 Tax=Metopolophium dirhodum TaxID=44670 RepID=UPI00298F9613|nr:uncharacterized protein LOC132941229 isoform X1 [Metopolophium dirhodum]XP_060865161.1 uncharacterized protein LOC132941229 isoform X1 [Metopolophium dirhodum]XP_060865162.1 uncharacterized protein LOC132941229 isoform X1 [Metopolophium dirhodum]